MRFPLVVWSLISQAAHTLPTRRAVVDLQTYPSIHRSRLERLMQTAPMRATVAFVIPSIALATQVAFIERAYKSQMQLRKVWELLEPIVISALGVGWTAESGSQAGVLLISFQSLAAEVVHKARAAFVAYLFWVVLSSAVRHCISRRF